MRPADRPPCSSLSRAFEEEQGGTASRYRFWLMVEQPGPWEHDALVSSRFPAPVGAELRRRERGLGLRVLLIKRRDRPQAGPRRCFAAFTGRRDRRLVAFQVDDPHELLELDLRSLVRARFEGLGHDVSGPLFLVCTHGKHDPCCARHGAPLYRALSEREDVWESTHVGGDRFAGNLVCFPHGLYFGRVTPPVSEEVVAAYAAGRIELAHYRGRSAFGPAVQAAEVFLRRSEGLVGVDDLRYEGHRRDGDLHTVAFRAGRTMHRLDIQVSLAHERPLTCKASGPHRPRAFALRGVRSSPV